MECEGKVHTSKGSLINGNVNSKSAYINGKIKGDLVVEKKVVLAKFSQLKGNLVSSTLTIEEGARFDGMCSMVQSGNAKQSIKTSQQSSSSLNTANEQI